MYVIYLITKYIENVTQTTDFGGGNALDFIGIYNDIIKQQVIYITATGITKDGIIGFHVADPDNKSDIKDAYLRSQVSTNEFTASVGIQLKF